MMNLVRNDLISEKNGNSRKRHVLHIVDSALSSFANHQNQNLVPRILMLEEAKTRRQLLQDQIWGGKKSRISKQFERSIQVLVGSQTQCSSSDIIKRH